ncbi:ASCH domain-containing protein [Desulfobacula toluolica]|uniref:Conserved uncharacterized protein n=1 Tax=Desulfobacula toluolica (strain DSM 7467 / Tol2) TaxID=651182 RepID=K0NQF8_DESTT|nr:ASCH domain-containing protein [Desulfobacula toluolica]CCK81147.1 conserved uncharacterized protein [Desulfobacula toluolica Tol2]
MKAISVKQPWASLIVEGIKDIENRNWFTYYRGLLYIHASKGFDLQGAKLILELRPEYQAVIEKSKNERGGIIGHVNMIDCVKKHESPWFHGKYGFVLQLPNMIDFYPMRGKLSIFDFEFRDNENNSRQEIQLDLFDNF